MSYWFSLNPNYNVYIMSYYNRTNEDKLLQRIPKDKQRP